MEERAAALSQLSPKEEAAERSVLHEGLKKALAEMLVLFMLRQKPMYAYELMKAVEQYTDGHFQYNTLYIAIYRMQEKQYVTEYKVETTAANRTRVYLTITEQGQKYLDSCIREFSRTGAVMNALLAQDGRLYPPRGEA